MIAEIFGKTACKCDKCGHVWLENLAGLPQMCASRVCRSRKWNADNVAKQPEKMAEQPTAKPYETFQKSLCIHGVYKPLCRRCQAA